MRTHRRPPVSGTVRRPVPAPFVHSLRVRYGECDLQGIVFNANYLLYYDVAFTELWREAVGQWTGMVERGVDVVVAEAALRFRAPARYDDELDIRVVIARLGTTSFTTELEMLRGEALLVDGTMRHVCVDARTWRKRELPDWIRSGLERFTA
jgi:acyl-CoA thioester hydrolase